MKNILNSTSIAHRSMAHLQLSVKTAVLFLQGSSLLCASDESNSKENTVISPLRYLTPEML